MESFRETNLDTLEGENIFGVPKTSEEKVKESNLVRITSVVSKISRKRSLLITSFRLRNSENSCQKHLLKIVYCNGCIMAKDF